ncbi:MAG: CotH kinase family protein, partial [Planctomycetota bacterium]|nr:CotH kinase family protein [Planctomycetota bacterium]
MRSLNWLWKWSPMCTVPISILFLLWASGTLDRWLQFEVKVSTIESLDLRTVGVLEAEHMLRVAQAKTQVLGVQEAVQDSGLRTINLFLADSDRERLNRDLPHSGKEYVPGGMLYGGQYRKVQVRYRGDNVYHWGYWKKSWRIKTKSENLFEGMRKFNLVAPRTVEGVNNFLSLKVAAEMGLIAPKVELVNLLINGKNHGYHILTEQLSESTLRRNRRMPGDMYSGEMVGSDRYSGVPHELWHSAGTWTKVAVNNHYEETSKAPLEELIQVFKEARNTGDHRALSRLIDMDAFARFSAYESIVGTLHVSDEHNWRLYYDPWKGTFEPVAWDPVGWIPEARPRPWVPFRADAITNELEALLHKNGEFLAAKSASIDQFFERGGDRNILGVLEESIAALEPVIGLDPDLVFKVKSVAPEQAMRGLRELSQYLEEHFQTLYDAYGAGSGKLEFWAEGDKVRLWFEGVRHLDKLAIEYSEPLNGSVTGTLSWNGPRGTTARKLGGLLSATGSYSIELHSPLLADIRVRQRNGATWQKAMGGLTIEPGGYELVLDGLPKGASVTSVRGTRGQSKIHGKRISDPGDLPAMGELFDRVAPERNAQPLIWSGRVSVAGVQFLDRDLILRPGTELRLEPGASLIVRGRVQAEGTSEQPIR